MLRTLFLSLTFLAGVTLLALAQTTVKTTTAPQTSAASGQEMYVSYCAACHGRDGKGSGPAAKALKVPPSDLTVLARSNQGKFPDAHVYQVIKGDAMTPAHGSKDMPVWGPVFRALSKGDQATVQLRITNLTNYVESLQVKK
jgi:mono/diheme cytochrome c family protein